MKLHAYMDAHGITTQALADALGLSQPFVSRLKRGLKRPSVRLALKIEDHTCGAVTAAEMNADVALIQNSKQPEAA